MLSHDEDFLNVNIEAEIKAYFFLKRTPTNKFIFAPKRSFIAFFEKYNNNPRFYNTCKLLVRKQSEKLPQGKKTTNIVYNQQLHQFSASEQLKKQFIEYNPSDSVKKVVGGLLSHMFAKGTVSLQHAKIVHHLLNRFPLLTPFVLTYPLDGVTLLDRLIQTAL